MRGNWQLSYLLVIHNMRSNFNRFIAKRNIRTRKWDAILLVRERSALVTSLIVSRSSVSVSHSLCLQFLPRDAT